MRSVPFLTAEDSADQLQGIQFLSTSRGATTATRTRTTTAIAVETVAKNPNLQIKGARSFAPRIPGAASDNRGRAFNNTRPYLGDGIIIGASVGSMIHGMETYQKPTDVAPNSAYQSVSFQANTPPRIVLEHWVTRSPSLPPSLQSMNIDEPSSQWEHIPTESVRKAAGREKARHESTRTLPEWKSFAKRTRRLPNIAGRGKTLPRLKRVAKLVKIVTKLRRRLLGWKSFAKLRRLLLRWESVAKPVKSVTKLGRLSGSKSFV